MSTTVTPAWDRSDLDPLTCAAPGCTGNHHHGPMFLSGRCHPKKPQTIEYRFGGVVIGHCQSCGLHTFNIALSPEDQALGDARVLVAPCPEPGCTTPPEMHMLSRRAPCHPAAGLHCVYENGALFLLCGQCQDPIAKLGVKERSGNA